MAEAISNSDKWTVEGDGEESDDEMPEVRSDSHPARAPFAHTCIR